jgi:cell division protein FtsW
MKNFLPMAFSDFIFAIILEEYGAWGGILVLAAFLLLMYRSIIVMRRCQKPFHAFVIMGITIIIEIQALINMLVGVGLMPVTGQTLPFVSQGGSSDIFMGFAFGIILSVSNVNPAPVVAKATDAPSADAESDEHQASTNADDGDYYEEAEAITFG